MTFYLKLFGGLLLLVGALLISQEYSAYCKRRILEYDGFIALLLHAESKISKYLASGEGLWRDFENDALLKCGFLECIKSGDTPLSAFRKCEGSLNLSKSAKDKLRALFSVLGEEYREGEISRLSSFREELLAERNAEEDRLMKSVKVTRALLVSSALAVIIIFI